MKKFLFFLMAFAVLLGAFTSCESCDREKQKKDVVETLVNIDIDYMNQNYDSFVWYESSIVLDKYLDEESCDGSVESVTNIFQVGYGDSTISTKKVVMITHNDELILIKEVEGFWCEDVVMDTNDIEYTFNRAYERYMQSNCVKPHSRYCVLRKPLGPCICNAQYIFGSSNGILTFLDAVTGECSPTSPAFNCRE